MEKRTRKKLMKKVGAFLGVIVVVFLLYRSINLSLDRHANNGDCSCGKKQPIEAEAETMAPKEGMPQQAATTPPGDTQNPTMDNGSTQEPSSPDELKDEEGY
ncbi:MAG TPA: hypothetical protein VFU89_06540 [Rhabdochlamydiaceae bacterium]|nr:hypothetical protein [Rhabdochlamydiaceae bacterium]